MKKSRIFLVFSLLVVMLIACGCSNDDDNGDGDNGDTHGKDYNITVALMKQGSSDSRIYVYLRRLNNDAEPVYPSSVSIYFDSLIVYFAGGSDSIATYSRSIDYLESGIAHNFACSVGTTVIAEQLILPSPYSINIIKPDDEDIFIASEVIELGWSISSYLSETTMIAVATTGHAIISIQNGGSYDTTFEISSDMTSPLNGSYDLLVWTGEYLAIDTSSIFDAEFLIGYEASCQVRILGSSGSRQITYDSLNNSFSWEPADSLYWFALLDFTNYPEYEYVWEFTSYYYPFKFGPPIIYGNVPLGAVQNTPSSGSPAPLVSGNIYQVYLGGESYMYFRK